MKTILKCGTPKTKVFNDQMYSHYIPCRISLSKHLSPMFAFMVTFPSVGLNYSSAIHSTGIKWHAQVFPISKSDFLQGLRSVLSC